MESFHWGPHFITGLTDVDEQHHHLVDLINQFSTLLASGEVDLKDVDQLFTKLSDYSKYHFDEEEDLMTEYGVDSRHLDRHIKAHDRFLDDVSTIYSEITPRNFEQARSFLNYLVHWLAYHILGQDQDVAKQIKAIKVGMSPSEAYDKLEQERLTATAPLLEALNGLFEQVTMRNAELKELNELLEEKVALRTRELSEANLHLEELSLTDVLTGLPNRRHAMRELARLWDESLENNTPLSCLMIDADHFKQVNDTYGHDAGDVVLIELARTLRDNLRNDDLVCRLGGDEFFIICPGAGEDDAMNIAKKTHGKVTELRVATGDGAWEGSISVGVASRLDHMTEYEELIKEADKGVYLAKDAGKNCVRSAG